MDALVFSSEIPDGDQLISEWKEFLIQKKFSSEKKISIHFDQKTPLITNSDGLKFRIHFLNDSENYNKFKKSIHHEPLARALGSGHKGLRLLDLSAGLAVDSIFLMQLGFHVTAVERNPLIYLCLNSALHEASEIKNLKFLFGDSLEYITNLNPDQFDVGYFDPMFAEKKKSALAKQEMRFFKDLVGADLDAEKVVFEVVRRQIFKRFVVKRALKAPTLGQPQGSIEGKIIRYDIYGG